MNNTNSLSVKIEKLRKELSAAIDNNLHNMTIDKLIDKSNKLNKLIVEYHKQTKTDKND